MYIFFAIKTSIVCIYSKRPPTFTKTIEQRLFARVRKLRRLMLKLFRRSPLIGGLTECVTTGVSWRSAGYWSPLRRGRVDSATCVNPTLRWEIVSGGTSFVRKRAAVIFAGFPARHKEIYVIGPLFMISVNCSGTEDALYALFSFKFN